MVFIRKINDYYVLGHSVRKGSKIIQKTKYIGKSLPPKKIAEQLKKEFLCEIMGKQWKYLSPVDFELIEKKREQYNEEIKELSSGEKKKRFEEFLIRYTYDSNKLSGIDVTLRETHLILKDGIIPKNMKNLKTIKELENHKKGVVACTEYKGSLTSKFLKKIHTILFSGVDDSIAGKVRSELKRDVKIAGTSYIPPKWYEIDNELKRFFQWYDAEKRKFHHLELAALVHLRLISLQPFADGNSRLSRLIMNWMLWKKKYPMIDIPIEDVEEYYNVLDSYQIEKNEKPFVNYIKKKFLVE